MIETYAKEFVAIVDFIIANDYVYRQKDDNIAVDKDIIVKLLHQNMYDKPIAKMAVWRALKWIISESDRYTKMVKTQDGYKRLMVIDTKIHQKLKQIIDSNYKNGN